MLLKKFEFWITAPEMQATETSTLTVTAHKEGARKPSIFRLHLLRTHPGYTVMFDNHHRQAGQKYGVLRYDVKQARNMSLSLPVFLNHPHHGTHRDLVLPFVDMNSSIPHFGESRED
jgi:hypothetical protein